MFLIKLGIFLSVPMLASRAASIGNDYRQLLKRILRPHITILFLLHKYNN